MAARPQLFIAQQRNLLSEEIADLQDNELSGWKAKADLGCGIKGIWEILLKDISSRLVGGPSFRDRDDNVRAQRE